MISLITNHYEKFILVVLLIIFVIALTYQVTILQEAQTQQVERIISQKDPETDYKKIDFLKPEYTPDQIFSSSLLFERRDLSTDPSKLKSDILTCFPLVACIHCGALIPSALFPEANSKTSGNCSQCGQKLEPKAAALAAAAAVMTGPLDNDMNRNSIPDEWEKKYKLITDNETKADGDLDEDGFTLYEEYKAGTDPTNPKSHPSYTTKLFVENIEVTKIPYLRLTRVEIMDSDKSSWIVHFNIRLSRNRPKTRFLKIGQTFKNMGEEFKVVDIEKTESPDLDIVSMKSIVVISRLGQKEKIRCSVNTSITDPLEKITFYDAASNRTFSKSQVDTLTLGSEHTGLEVYTIKNKDVHEKTVILEEKGKKRTVFIPRKSENIKSDEKSKDLPPDQELPE